MTTYINEFKPSLVLRATLRGLALGWALPMLSVPVLGWAQSQSPDPIKSPSAEMQFLSRPIDPKWLSLADAIDNDAVSSQAMARLRNSVLTDAEIASASTRLVVGGGAGAAVASATGAPGVPAGVRKEFLGQVRAVPSELLGAAELFAAQSPVSELRPFYRRLYIEGERNAVLNFQRLALAAMSAQQWDVAEKSLDAALLRIDTLYANNPQAQQARSVFSAESVKDFKGEPYERAMAFYYRGLLYTARGDYQNARAMFIQADYQDTVSEKENFAGDFGLMPMLAAWASACDGNPTKAQEFLEAAVRADASLSRFDPKNPMLVLYEAGRAPFKINVGQHKQGLSWQAYGEKPVLPSPNCEATPGAVCVGNLFKAADVGFQATTRGGRAIDVVLAGKASFKETAGDVAQTANEVSQVALTTALLTNNRDMANLGIFGAFLGLAATMVEKSTQTQADNREWEQLPLEIWAAQGPAAKLGQTTILKLGQTTPASMGVGGSCKLYWARENNGSKVQYEAGPIEPSSETRDIAFRAGLGNALVALTQGG